MQRNVTLDILRAFAILTVFLGHTVKSFGSPPLLKPLQFGGSGVDLFFVLSGWLIGSQLFSEVRSFGDIELKRFWVRRWMRTLPAYYVVLFLTVIQQYATQETYTFPFTHLFFVQNYFPDSLSLFYVSWSLCVEEQFYLLIAPVVLALCTLQHTTRLLAFVALLLLPTVFRQVDLYESLLQTHVRIDCCIIGVFLAYLNQTHRHLFKCRTSVKLIILGISVIAYCMVYVGRYSQDIGIGEPSKLVLALIFGSWIFLAADAAYTKKNWFTRVAMHVSTRSYAMYLLHVDALVVTKRFFSDENFLFYLLVALIITLLAAEILHKCVEIPVMNMRNRFEISQSRHRVARKMPDVASATQH